MLRNAAAFAAVATEAAARADETGKMDACILAALHRSGLLLAPFAPSHGGFGLGQEDQQATLGSILRLVGAADLALARLFEGHVNAVLLVSRYGSTPQIASLAASAKDGALSGVWGAEDAQGLRCCVEGNDRWLEGGKVLASGAGLVARPLITVTTPDGPMLYLLDLPDQTRADNSAWLPLGMKATASGAVDLTGVRVGPDQQIGVAGDFLRQPFFSAGAWRFCAAQLGAMERLAALFGEELRARGRHGDPYQLERVAQCTAASGTVLFWVEEASRRFGDASLAPASVVAFSNLTRMVTEHAALEVMQCVQRGAGLKAFLRPHPIERICRDLATYLRQPVPDLAMSDAARAVLAGQLTIGALP